MKPTAPFLIGFGAGLAIALSATAQSPNSPVGPLGGAGLSAEGVPPELVGVDIVENLGVKLPLDLPFVDDDGKPTTLGAILANGKPVLLHLGYYRCPMLCTMVLNEAVRSLGKLDWTAGTDFEFVSASINPDDSVELAAAKKQGYLAEYGREGVGRGWHFLTAPQTSSQALADAVGFKFRRLPDGEYAHAAALFLVAPDGRLVRYLYGVKFEPQTVRMALVEAGQGTIGTPLDRFILWCHQYDPTEGSYTLLAFRLMQVGGAITVVLLASGIGWMWWRDSRKKSLQPPVEAQSANAHAIH